MRAMSRDSDRDLGHVATFSPSRSLRQHRFAWLPLDLESKIYANGPQETARFDQYLDELFYDNQIAIRSGQARR